MKSQKIKNIVIMVLLLLAVFVGLCAEGAGEMAGGLGTVLMGTTAVGVSTQDQFTAQFGANQIVTNGTLKHEEHITWDQTVVKVARRTLRALNDLRQAGLVKTVNFGTILSQYQRVSDMIEASMSMDGMARGNNDKLTFDSVGVPIPIIHQSFPLSKRQIEASRRNGETLDTTYVGIATASVAERVEKMIFQGAPSIVVDGKTIYGYTTLPTRGTVDMAADGWLVPSGRDIIGDVKNALDDMVAMKKAGPFTLYVSSDIWTTLQLDYSASKGEKTFRERILAFPQIAKVEYSDFLLSGHAVLVQMTEDCVDFVVAQDIINVEFGDTPLTTNFLVYGAMVPRLKTDQEGNCGVVHLTPSV
jgi:uncharacterized linocin/CFP29 family protein